MSFLGDRWSNLGIEQGRLFVIAGPCAIESEQLVMETAQALKGICQKLNVPLIFKSSYDKANRTSERSFRGPGLTEGLNILSKLKEQFSLPVLSDVHSIEQIEPASEVLDIMQIPAFLCRQTDLLIKAGQLANIVNVKKGQFLAPWDMKNVVDKLLSSGNQNICLTERGVSFGYNNLVADMRSIMIMSSWGHPVIFDATHSVQLPGGGGTVSAGQSEFAARLSYAACAAGCDGLFYEVHPDPSKALSDGPNMIALDQFEEVLEKALRIYREARR